MVLVKRRASERRDGVAVHCSGLSCPATAVSHTVENMRTVWQSKGKHNAASSPELKIIGLDQRTALFLLFGKEKTFMRPLSQKAKNKC